MVGVGDSKKREGTNKAVTTASCFFLRVQAIN